MGQYKVPQNVEAEDKIIGFLTLKQFLYAIAGVGFGIITWFVGKLIPPLYMVGAIPTVLFLMLAFYQPQGQPFEALFLAMVSYFVKSRKRLWIKEPIAEVFKIEAPKPVVEGPHVDPREVYGQLEKLSQIVDTRGWSSKQAELQEPTGISVAGTDYEERLGGVDLTTAIGPEPAIGAEVNAADDILDPANPTAQNLKHLIEDNAQAQRSVVTTGLQTAAASAAPVAEPATPGTSVMTPAPPTAILKEAMENTELKVSHLAASVARKAGQLTEGQAVDLHHGSTKDK